MRRQFAGQAERQHIGEADDRVQGRAQLMAHIGEELRFGDIGRLGRDLGVAQTALGQHLRGDVARRAAIAGKLLGFVEHRITADRYDLLGVALELPDVDEITEGFVPFQYRPVLEPFVGLSVGTGDHLEPGMADRGAGILPEAADAVRHVGEPMVAVGLPQPIRGHRREIAKPCLALAQGMCDLP